MTAAELARLLGKLIAQGCGEHQVALFQHQDQEGAELVTEVLVREHADLVELYSGTVPGAVGAVIDEEDLLGLPAADEADDLDDLI